MLMIAYIFFCWKQLKPGIIKGLYWIKCGFLSDNFDMQMDFVSYSKTLKSVEKPTEEQLIDIHYGIEAFRNEWKDKCDPRLVSRYVKELFEIHNMKPLDFEVTVEGMLMSQSKI